MNFQNPQQKSGNLWNINSIQMFVFYSSVITEGLCKHFFSEPGFLRLKIVIQICRTHST